jgi:hypothetical protein
LIDKKLNLRNLKVGAVGKSPIKKHESKFVIGLYAPTTRSANYEVYNLSRPTRRHTRHRIALKDVGGQRRYHLGAITLVD